MEVNVQLQAPDTIIGERAPFPPVTTVWEAGWAPERSAHSGEEERIPLLLLKGIEARSSRMKVKPGKIT
jgi:hypothetical protein